MRVRKKCTKILSLILVVCMLLGLMPANTVVAADSISTDYSRINVQTAEAGVFELAQAQFAAKGKSVELVYNEESTAGDIVVNTNGAADTYGEEGYSISVPEGKVVVNAATNKGAVYGLQDVLQQLEKGTVEEVSVTQPFKEMRALFVDCARKYFSVSWFEEIIREMAWNGMNTLYISFSNDEGFRFLLNDMALSFDDGEGNTVAYSDEFMSHLVDNPEKVSDSTFLTERNANATDEGNSRVVTNYDNNKYLTQKDMERILAYAKAYGINVIPELNSPGHFGQVMWYFPEYRIQGTWYEDGQPHYGLDLTNTEAANFGAALVKKYVDFFADQGCTAFCIGGDEYNKGNATNEQVAAYTNGLAGYVENKGMTAYAWNDGQAAAKGLLKNSVIVNCWNGSSNYKSVNFNSSYLYYVLKGYEWKPNAQSLFETWTPLTYSGDTIVNSEKTVGSSLALWCDVPNKETGDYVLESLIPDIQAFGYRMWNYSETATTSLGSEYESYSEFAAAVTKAPTVAEETVLETVGYEITMDDITLPEPSVGEGYELVNFSAPSVSTNSGWYSGANNLIDGNTSTNAWTNASQAVGHYMRVDLGKVQTVETISITSPAHGDTCTNAKVQVSVDGSDWEDIGIHTGNSGTPVTDNYQVNKEIRYVQIVITEAKNNWWQVAEISWTPKSSEEQTIEDGTYIIVNDTNKAMTHTASGDGFAMSQVTIDGTIATPVNEVYEWRFAKQSDGTYYITDCDGNYLNITSEISVSNTPQAITATIFGGKVQLSNGNNAINYYSGNGQIFARWNAGTNDNNNMQTLYKKLTSSLDTSALYNAITKAKSFSNDDNRYGSNEFAALQTVLNESINLYIAASKSDTIITQTEVDAQTEALEAAITALEISDTSVGYIEIPIEILDFRADGVMFEYAQNTGGKGLYELLTDTKFGDPLTYGKENVPMPGTIGDRITADEWHVSESEPQGWYNDCKRTGLVEDYLVNNAPVYKEVTVDYVAKLIAKGYFTNLSGSITNWNSTISEKVNTLYDGYDENTDTNTNLGSWSETLAKTSTQANGGNMTWSNVATCYDLAYYVLNNMWRSTEAADGENAYNKRVGERTILRMLSGEDGYYYLDSTKQISYNGNYVYNTDLVTENTAETKFTPINNLGYEASDGYGDTTDATSGINFHFTLHANGSFVYNADDNLYFYFDGDDDVYYYINGRLVMDIGGAHAHCDNELYLNDIADELGLVDGGIYTFDMFYAERHTTQANLEFRTNIKIMDTMSTTSKGQYNAATGETIPYGAIVDEGTTVAYSFNLLNLRSVNVTDISFTDESLGSYLSGETITLYDATKTNGATTAITDIIVYYHTYDRPAPSELGVLNNEAVTSKTVAEITEMINTSNNNNYASLEKGSYIVRIQSEEELKALLTLGVPIDTQICVYGVKRNVTENDRPYINTVTSRAYYVSNNKKIALNGIASQKLTVLNSFKSIADKEQIVIDYGKAVQINLANINDNINGKDNKNLNEGVNAEFYGITVNGAHNQIRTSGDAFTELGKDYSPSVSNGTYKLLGTDKATKIEFKLKQLLSKVEKVFAVYKIVDSSLVDTPYESYYYFVEVDIIPATVMYYETDFANGVFTFTTSGNAWSTVNDNSDSTAEKDEIQDDGTIGNNQTYGYDSSYADAAILSNGTSYYVEGQGRKNTYVDFSFTGTGFDLISRTGTEQGGIRVDIYTDAAMTAKVKSVTVLNKSESNLELYQIPVVSVNDLTYGTYYVRVGVNSAYDDPTNDALDMGNQFYFDAVRVYDPIDTTAANENALIAKTAYAADGEYGQVITEVRAMLLDSKTYNSSVKGMLFVDRTTDGSNNVEVGTYETIGPNNEVYLKPGQAIAFRISSAGSIASVDIGAKSADGKPVGLQATIANGTDDKADGYKSYNLEKDIATSTSLYYDILSGASEDDYIGDYFNDEGNAYVVITNPTDNILSITDIKVAYYDVPSATNFFVGEDVLSFASYCMLRSATVEPNYDIQNAEFTATSCAILRKTQMVVVTTTDVEKIEVTNQYGMPMLANATSEINEEGMKVWTVTFRPFMLGKQSYIVTGYGEDGTSGASATASVRVKLF